jgi:hypothetical protein
MKLNTAGGNAYRIVMPDLSVMSNNLDDSCLEFDRWEEEFAEKLNQQNRDRDIRNRREEPPDTDRYEEMQIERFDMVANVNNLMAKMGGVAR